MPRITLYISDATRKRINLVAKAQSKTELEVVREETHSV